MWHKPHGFYDKENYKEKLPRLVFEVHAITLVTVRIYLCTLGVHKSTMFPCNCRSRADSVDGVRYARRTRRNNFATRRSRCARRARSDTAARRSGGAARRCRSAAGRDRSGFGVFRNLAVEVFLTFAGEGENQHAVSGVNILVGEVHAVAVESPVTFAPAGAIERIEIVGPIERKVATAFALARRVLINFDPVDELEKRKLRFIKLANPSRTLRRPKVKTESLCTCQVGNLATFRLAAGLTAWCFSLVI